MQKRYNIFLRSPILVCLLIALTNRLHSSTPAYIQTQIDAGQVSQEDQDRIKAGYLNVLLYNGWNDPNGTMRNVDPDPTDGWSDSTKAIQKAIDDAHANNLALWFPTGNYKISDSLGAFQYSNSSAWDTKVNNLVGEAPGAVSISLASGAGKFQNGNSPRPMIVFRHFFRNSGSTATWAYLSQKRNGNYPAFDAIHEPTGYATRADVKFRCVLRNINFDCGGNTGAIGVYFPAAQNSSLIDVHVNATGAHTGIWGVPGANAGAVNISVEGGRYGIDIRTGNLGGSNGTDAIAGPALAGITLTNQTTACVRIQDIVPSSITGFYFKRNSGPVFSIPSGNTATGTCAFVDGIIETNGGNEGINNTQGKTVFLRNVWFKGNGTNTLVRNKNGVNLTGSGSWKHVPEYVYCDQNTNQSNKWRTLVRNMINGSVHRNAEPLGKNVLNNAPAPPNDIVTRHMVSNLPLYNGVGGGTISVKAHGAKGNNSANDTAAIQAAIDTASNAGHGRVFLPVGDYRIANTLTLHANTVFFGVGRKLSRIRVHHSWRPTSGEATMFRTVDDASATTFLGFLTIEARTKGGGNGPQTNDGWARNEYPDKYDRFNCLHWRAGRNSLSVNLDIHKTWTAKQATNPHSKVKFTDSGGGRHYFLTVSSQDYSDRHPDYRKFLFEGTSEPTWMYGFNMEHAESDAESEIRNSSNIRIYGIKNEGGGPYNDITNGWGMIPSVLIKDSQNIGVFAIGGLRQHPSQYPAVEGAIVVVGASDNIVIGPMIVHAKLWNANGRPMLHEHLDSSSANKITWPDGVAIYKRGSLDDTLMAHDGGSLISSSAKYFIEIESMTVSNSSGDQYSIVTSNPDVSGGSFGYFFPNEEGDFISYYLNVPDPGTYALVVDMGPRPNAGIVQVSVDGVDLGNPQDLYNPQYIFENRYLGDTTFPSNGQKEIKFTITGKNPSSTDYNLRLDYIRLTHRYSEFENMVIRTDSDDPSNIVDNENANGGQFLNFQADAADDFLEYALSVDAGEFHLYLGGGPSPASGTVQISLIDDEGNEVIIGSSQDFYSPTYDGFFEKYLGSINYANAAELKLRLTITGKNAASSGYALRLDSIRVTSESPNTPPSLNTLSNQSVDAGCVAIVPLSASDAEGDVLSFSATNLPAFATLHDRGDSTGFIIFNTDENDNPAQYSINVSVSDSQGAEDSTSFQLDVVNLP